jgi:hypothetical protein
MAKNRVTYAIGTDDKTYIVMFPKCQKVSDFVELVKEKHENTDLCNVCLSDSQLDKYDLFDDWWYPGCVLRLMT